MGKFRKKPVDIEAVKYKVRGDLQAPSAPQWLLDAVTDGTVTVFDDHARIRTLEGVHRANINDYIIRGVKGELYPCKPDVFHLTYDAI